MFVLVPQNSNKTDKVILDSIFRAASLLFFLTLLSSQSLLAETNNEDKIRVAYFSQDPPSIVSLSPAIDPDSYSVIAQLFDSLVYMDLEGNFKPGLATSWRQLSPTQWEFELRKGVKFHNGEKFDAHAVKFTFDYLLNPKNNAGNRWMFSTLKSVEFDPKTPFKVTFNLLTPDGMFLNRFNMFGSICPPNYIKNKGFALFEKNPIGTGPYKFKKWDKGKAILLERNPDYWQTNIPHIKEIEFLMLPSNQWVEAFANNQVDFIPNLSGSETKLLMEKSNGRARILKDPVLISYWVMIRNEGALDNVQFRRALNHAINRRDLVHFADFGNALPLASLGKRGETGANMSLKPFPYDLERAQELIQKSGVKLPIKLKVLASEIAERPTKIIQRNLKDIGVELEVEYVSRSEWTKRVVIHKVLTGQRADYDMVINMVDNPIYNLAFHAGLFLESSSPWSLLNSKDFDKKFLDALTQADEKTHIQKLQALDEYIQSQALMLFTTQKIITAAVNKKFDIKKFGANGHLNYEVLSKARIVNDTK